MLHKHKKIKTPIYVTLVYVAFTAICLQVSDARAGTCSPGIPCTGYDIYSRPDANTLQDYNARKSGHDGWTPGTPPTYSHMDSACDGNFMNQIYARAFLESQREVMLAEQIIHKPDSVLEYTCFDQYAGQTKEHLDSLFSGRQEWLNKSVPLWTADDINDTVEINSNGVTYFPDQTQFSVFEPDRYDNILEDLLLITIEDYIDLNFDHTFMGESITLDNNIDTSGFPTNYNCAHMLSIWEIAKCVDFGEDDRFRSFNTLVDSEIRSIPEACHSINDPNTPTSQLANDAVPEGGAASSKLNNTQPGEDISTGGPLPMPTIPSVTIPVGSSTYTISGNLRRMPSDAPNESCPPAGDVDTRVDTGISNDIIRLANNCDDGTNTNAYSATDLMETYNHLIKGFGVVVPGSGSPTSSFRAGVICSPPIPTGLPVLTYIHADGIDGTGLPTVDRDTFIHYDHICPNPGCYYRPVKSNYLLSAPIPDEDAIPTGVCTPSF